jgi:hypothetical protein
VSFNIVTNGSTVIKTLDDRYRGIASSRPNLKKRGFAIREKTEIVDNENGTFLMARRLRPSFR